MMLNLLRFAEACSDGNSVQFFFKFFIKRFYIFLIFYILKPLCFSRVADWMTSKWNNWRAFLVWPVVWNKCTSSCRTVWSLESKGWIYRWTREVDIWKFSRVSSLDHNLSRCNSGFGLPADLVPLAGRMFYILFQRSHSFSTAGFNCFKNLQKSRCGARSVYGPSRSMFLFLNYSLWYFEQPWLTVNNHERLKTVDRLELSC